MKRREGREERKKKTILQDLGTGWFKKSQIYYN